MENTFNESEEKFFSVVKKGLHCNSIRKINISHKVLKISQFVNVGSIHVINVATLASTP